MKHCVLDWVKAKFKVRYTVLQGSETEAAQHLLKSNVWDPELFGRQAIKDLPKHKEVNQTTKEALRITEDKNRKLYKERNRLLESSLHKKFGGIFRANSDNGYKQKPYNTGYKQPFRGNSYQSKETEGKKGQGYNQTNYTSKQQKQQKGKNKGGFNKFKKGSTSNKQNK